MLVITTLPAVSRTNHILYYLIWSGPSVTVCYYLGLDTTVTRGNTILAVQVWRMHLDNHKYYAENILLDGLKFCNAENHMCTAISLECKVCCTVLVSLCLPGDVHSDVMIHSILKTYIYL